MYRIGSLVIGYLFGNLLTAELVARLHLHKSAFEIGSGNPGTANITKQAGLKYGAIVLSGDILKTVAACLLCRYVLFPPADGLPLSGALRIAWAGLGCTIGHNLPFWHRFKGGKGVATTCATLFLISPVPGTLAMLIGLAAVKLKKSLAWGGILIPAAFIPFSVMYFGNEMTFLTLVLTAFMVWRHFGSLKEEMGR